MRIPIHLCFIISFFIGIHPLWSNTARKNIDSKTQIKTAGSTPHLTILPETYVTTLENEPVILELSVENPSPILRLS